MRSVFGIRGGNRQPGVLEEKRPASATIAELAYTQRIEHSLVSAKTMAGNDQKTTKATARERGR
jgi:hypothetical protein